MAELASAAARSIAWIICGFGTSGARNDLALCDSRDSRDR